MLNLTKTGEKHGEPLPAVVLAILQTVLAQRANAVTALTDNGGGTAANIAYPATAVNVADAGTTSAQKAATEAAWATVKDAIAELYTKANAIAAVVSANTWTYNGGGTTPDGTIGAITVATTAATTGVLATNTNIVYAGFNTAFYNLTVFANRLAESVGVARIPLPTAGGTYLATIPSLVVDGGTAASPGVTKASVDAALVIYAANAKKLATLLNAIRALPAPGIAVHGK